MKKEYIYKVTYYKQVAEEFYKSKDEIEAENLALDVLHDSGLDEQNGDFFKVEIADCDMCDNKATKKDQEGFYVCENCYVEWEDEYNETK